MNDKQIKLPSNPKGKRASFYDDPSIDRIFSIITLLAQELSVTYDKIETLERLLEKKEIIKRSDIEKWLPGEKEEKERTQRRDAFISRVFHIIHEDAESATKK
tara:strand:+ start:1771 stop:2079 length:309 start_codon:yes stop_codon:yes gene_type:complete